MNNRLVHSLVRYLHTAYLWKEIDHSTLYVQDYFLLDCDTVQTGRHLQTFRKNLLPLSSRSETIMNIAYITDWDFRISSKNRRIEFDFPLSRMTCEKHVKLMRYTTSIALFYCYCCRLGLYKDPRHKSMRILKRHQEYSSFRNNY
jgi:hypothetical protein